MDRFKRIIASCSRAIDRLRQEARNLKAHIQNRREKRDRDDEKRAHLDKVIANLIKRQQAYVAEHGERDEELQEAIDERKQWRTDLRTRRERITDSIARFAEKSRRRYKRIRWNVVKRTKYRQKLREARRRLDPKWEPWMANGANAYVTDAVKQEMAIAVVTYDLAVTSLYRATVIPQSNPNSYHGPNTRPGRAGDVAGARMTEYQRNVFTRRRGNCAESFGPDNAANLKYGAPYYLPEGSFLENLHDSHVHVAP